MAGNRFSIETGPIALSSGTPKSVWVIQTPANIRLYLHQLKFHGVGNTPGDTPVQFNINLCTVGSLAGTTLAFGGTTLPKITKLCQFAATLQSVIKGTITAEPTISELLRSFNVHPQAQWDKYIPMERPFLLEHGSYYALYAANIPQNSTFNIEADLEE